MATFRLSSSTPASLARTGLFLLSILFMSSNAMISAFVPTAGNPLKLNESAQRQHRFFATRRQHQSQLYSSRAKNQYTEFEILDMKRRVLSISTESNDETRRSYVSKWITSQATKFNYEEGVRLIQLWDITVVQLGEELQNTLKAKAKKKSHPCSSIGNDDKLVLWSFVDMLVQTKTLINKLGIPKVMEGRRILNDQRIHYKLDKNIGALENDERAFQ